MTDFWLSSAKESARRLEVGSQPPEYFFFPFSLLWTTSLVVAASPLCPQFPLNISWYCQAILPGLLPPVMAFVSTAFSHWPTGSESDSGFLQLLILGLPPLPPVLSSSSNLRFLLNLNTIDILGWMILCCRGCPVCYKMISSIHGLTLSTRYQEPQCSYDNRMSSDICQTLPNVPWGVESAQIENDNSNSSLAASHFLY